MPTLGEISTLFARYIGAGNDATERINLVQARLLPEGYWRGTKVPIDFVVYPDSAGNSTVTLPRHLESILVGGYQATTTSGGYPLAIRNGWYQFSPSGPGLSLGTDGLRGIVALEGRYTTFADWSTAKRLRIKVEQNEIAASITFRGTLAGSKIYTLEGVDWIEGVELDYSTATVTTTQTFDTAPYQIIKPETYGRLSLFTVDSSDVEVAVGVYEPGETTPSYKRYRVPGNCSEDSTTFSTICKKAYVPLVVDEDELIIGNLGANRHGLEALLKEDASDYVRAQQLWELAKDLLIKESENDHGGAESHVVVDDTFQMAQMNGDSWYG